MLVGVLERSIVFSMILVLLVGLTTPVTGCVGTYDVHYSASTLNLSTITDKHVHISSNMDTIIDIIDEVVISFHSKRIICVGI